MIPIGNDPERVFMECLAERFMVSKLETSTQTIGRFVRDRRVANNLSQQKLAELAGVGTRLISELERGKSTLRMDAVNKVLHVFGQTLGHTSEPREDDLT